MCHDINYFVAKIIKIQILSKCFFNFFSFRGNILIALIIFAAINNFNENKLNKKILRLALPNIITNITVPLLGIVDLAIVGHIGNEQYIGAIGIGTTIFNMIYWNFGFLRMGTSGFTAQAYGANDMKESVKILVRASVIALSIAALLLLLQYPIALLSKNFVRGSEEMIDYTLEYFYVRIWAAPATLGLYAIKG